MPNLPSTMPKPTASTAATPNPPENIQRRNSFQVKCGRFFNYYVPVMRKD